MATRPQGPRTMSNGEQQSMLMFTRGFINEADYGNKTVLSRMSSPGRVLQGYANYFRDASTYNTMQSLVKRFGACGIDRVDPASRTKEQVALINRTLMEIMQLSLKGTQSTSALDHAMTMVHPGRQFVEDPTRIASTTAAYQVFVRGIQTFSQVSDTKLQRKMSIRPPRHSSTHSDPVVLGNPLIRSFGGVGEQWKRVAKHLKHHPTLSEKSKTTLSGTQDALHRASAATTKDDRETILNSLIRSLSEVYRSTDEVRVRGILLDAATYVSMFKSDVPLPFSRSGTIGTLVNGFGAMITMYDRILYPDSTE